MKNPIVLGLLLSLTMPCLAQKNLFKSLGEKGALTRAFSKNAQQVLGTQSSSEVLRHARVVQGKILPGPKPEVSKYISNIERHIFAPAPALSGISLLQDPTPEQVVRVGLLYRRVMEEFKKFKKEMDVFLYYQSKPSEKRSLMPVERGEWASKIGHMHAQLDRLKTCISPADPAYKAAREYVAYAAEVVSPFMKGILLGTRQDRTDRVYKQEEFFLYTPKANEDAAWKGMLPAAVRARQTAGKLPHGIKMAVLNDRYSVLRRMQELNQAQKFFPGWEISYYQDTEALLNAVSYQGKEFDVILTDIVVPGGGGFYLTGVLRENKFKGAIIALAAFEEDKEIGQTLFSIGFDAMIPQSIGFERGKHWPLLIMKKLQNYFYYRDLNGWER